MIPNSRTPTHPGLILREEYLRPLGLTQVELSHHLGISAQQVSAMVRCRRPITPKTAWLLAQAFGTTPEFWLSLQASHDLALSKPRKRIKPLRRAG